MRFVSKGRDVVLTELLPNDFLFVSSGPALTVFWDAYDSLVLAAAPMEKRDAFPISSGGSVGALCKSAGVLASGRSSSSFSSSVSSSSGMRSTRDGARLAGSAIAEGSDKSSSTQSLGKTPRAGGRPSRAEEVRLQPRHPVDANPHYIRTQVSAAFQYILKGEE